MKQKIIIATLIVFVILAYTVYGGVFDSLTITPIPQEEHESPEAPPSSDTAQPPEEAKKPFEVGSLFRPVSTPVPEVRRELPEDLSHLQLEPGEGIAFEENGVRNGFEFTGDEYKVYRNGRLQGTVDADEFNKLYQDTILGGEIGETFTTFDKRPFLTRFSDWKENFDMKQVLPGIFSFMEGAMQYQGWGAINYLFHTKEETAERRAEVTQEFCEVTIVGTQQCFQETMCDKYSDHVGGNTGILYAPRANSLQQAAYIAGEKAQTIHGVNESGEFTMYVYLVEYSIFVPSDKEGVNYKLKFTGNQELIYPVEWLSVPSGGSVSMRGANPFVQPAQVNYNQICIIFEKPFMGTDILCNKIVEKEEGAIPALVSQFDNTPNWNVNIVITGGNTTNGIN